MTPTTAMEAWQKRGNKVMSETDYERLAYQVHEAGRQDYPKPWCQRAAAAVLEAWASERERELREDAERYRWLRDHSCPPHNFYISVPDEFHGVRYSPAEVDAYIDRARTLLAGERGG